MNGYVRALFTVPYGYLKLGLAKLFHFRKVHFGRMPRISKNTEISVDWGGAELVIGKRLNMREGARIRVRGSGKVVIGDNVSFGLNNMCACYEKIEIGNDVQFSPNVQIYDHDHDFSSKNGVKDYKYKTSAVKIGNNVWIGANAVILRGTSIGNNSVIAAGSIVKGNVPDDCVFVQKRKACLVSIDKKESVL